MVPYLDLKAQYKEIKDEINHALQRVLDSAQFVLGPEAKAFEEEFAAFSGVKHGIGVNSGTSALHLALLAAGVGPGDEVITTPFTFVATVAAIEYAGAKPVLVDIEPKSFTLDPAKIEAAITQKTKAILPVHLYGQPADMDPILASAKKHNLIVIEDAAQAHASEYKGRRVGSMGALACFSFYPGKNLGAYGEGGIVVTDNPEYNRTLRMLRDWGAEKKYQHVIKGFNNRLEAFQGAVLRVKLRRLEAWTELRRKHAQQYAQLLANCPGITPPIELEGRRHVYHVYTIRAQKRDSLAKFLGERNIHTGIHYPTPVHLLPAFANLGYGVGAFPQAEKAASEVLSLPMYPEMTSAMVAEVADALKTWTAEK